MNPQCWCRIPKLTSYIFYIDIWKIAVLVVKMWRNCVAWLIFQLTKYLSIKYTILSVSDTRSNRVTRYSVASPTSSQNVFDDRMPPSSEYFLGNIIKYLCLIWPRNLVDISISVTTWNDLWHKFCKISVVHCRHPRWRFIAAKLSITIMRERTCAISMIPNWRFKHSMVNLPSSIQHLHVSEERFEDLDTCLSLNSWTAVQNQV